MFSVRSAVEWKVSSLCRGDSVVERVVLAQRNTVIVNTRFVFDTSIIRLLCFYTYID